VRHCVARSILTVVTAAFAASLSTAADVRLSFLNDASSLQETTDLLVSLGCGKESTSTLRGVVESYYAEEFLLDSSQFPKRKGGFYTFQTMSNLVHALPHKLCDTKHSYGLNCYDTVILTAGDKLQIGLRADQNYGPFIVSQQLTNGSEVIRYAATPGDAFSLSYAEWYRNATESLFSEASKDARTCLVAEIFRWHVLPLSTTGATVQREVWAALKSDWQRTRLTFPENCQVVLYHMASVELHSVNTPHAGLLFSHDGGYTYLEKAGGKGPFVRLDFNDKSDLKVWMSAVFSNEQHSKLFLFATLNDTEIIKLD
jgi:hypothetical protein